MIALSLLALSSPASSFAQQALGLRIVVIEGEDSVNVIQQKTAVAPVVEVRDRNGNPVAGATVTFSVRGGRALLQNGARQLVVTTDAAGRATTALTPVGNGAVQIQATASVAGETVSTTISQVNVATAAEATKAAAGAGGGHTGLIVTTAALAGGGLGAWQIADRLNGDDELAESCGFRFQISPVSVPAAGGNFTFTFEANCNWIATTDQPWLVLIGPTSGNIGDNGPAGQSFPVVNLAYTVQPNQTTSSRVGRITVKPRNPDPHFVIPSSELTITQSAGPPTLFMLGAQAVTAMRIGACATPTVIDSVTLQLTGDEALVQLSVSSGCGSSQSYGPRRVARSGDSLTAWLPRADGGPPVLFEANIAGDELRATLQIDGTHVPLTLIRR